MSNNEISAKERLGYTIQILSGMLADGYRVSVPAALSLVDNAIAATGCTLPTGMAPYNPHDHIKTKREQLMLDSIEAGAAEIERAEEKAEQDLLD